MSSRYPGSWLAALGLAFQLLPTLAVAQTAAQRVDDYLSRLETLRASFHQEIVDGEGLVREEADGTLAIRKPGQFRWDYRTPSPQLLVSDGRTMWLYDPELEQATVRRADETLTATPASLLSGLGKASDSFTIRDGGQDGGLEWAILEPRLDDTDFREVRLAFRGKVLAGMELKDRLGQTTRIVFSDVQLNVELAAGLFQFEPPAGVDVIGSAGGG